MDVIIDRNVHKLQTPDIAIPDIAETGPDQTRPDQTRPDQTRPELFTTKKVKLTKLLKMKQKNSKYTPRYSK